MSGKLFINDILIDTEENVSFPITYSIADIKEPNKRARSVTKTIVLPDTLTNRRFFSSTYQISLSDIDNTGVGFVFDHNLKYPCYYEKNGVRIFSGSCRLYSASITDGVLKIEISLFSEIANLYQIWGDLKIAELGWSDYNHTLNKANIEASWTNLNDDGYVYGLIYYGYNNSFLTYKTTDLVPYIFQLDILKRALEFAGFELSSTTLTTTNFRKLLWGFGGGEKLSLTSTEVNNRKTDIDFDHDFYGLDTSPTSIYLSPNPAIQPHIVAYYTQSFNEINSIDSSLYTVNQDLLGQLDLNGTDWLGSQTIANKGDYNAVWSGECTIVSSIAPSYQLLEDLSVEVDYTFYIKKNGLIISTEKFSRIPTGNLSENITINVSSSFSANAGDVISLGIKFNTKTLVLIDTNTYGTNFTGNSFQMNVLNYGTGLNFTVESINEELQDGDTIDIVRHLPDMKVSDFFSDIITTHNLYIAEPDKGTVRIESFDAFYNPSSTFDDWTYKLDHSKEIKFEPPRIEGKDYVFKFAEDRDYYKDLYYTEFGSDYGDYKYTIQGSWKTGQKVWQTKFAQSIPVDVAPIGNGLGYQLIIPFIAQSNDDGSTFSPYKGKPRVFMYNGMEIGYPWEFFDSDGLNATTKATYPQFNHLDDLTTPTFDYNFGKPEKVYYTATAYTLNNIIQRDYFTFLNSLLNKSSKLMTASFNLSEFDLYNNFMQTFVNIDGVLFIKNVFTDFDPNNDETKSVELLKVVEARKPNTSLTSIPVSSPESYGMNTSNGTATNINEGTAQVIPVSSETKVLNDGRAEDVSYLPNRVTEFFDDATSEFDFSQFNVGSTFSLNVIANVDPTTSTVGTCYLTFTDGIDTFEYPMVSSLQEILEPTDVSYNIEIVLNDFMIANNGKVIFKNTGACDLLASSFNYTIKALSRWKR